MTFNCLVLYWGEHCSRMIRRNVSVHEAIGSISQVASNFFLKDGARSLMQAGTKLPNCSVNLVMTLIVVTKESSSTLQYGKIQPP